jgi:hypothetical protein
MKIRFNFIDMLTLLFIALKLTNNITWSWIWVLSPIWIYYSTLIVIAVVVIFSMYIFSGYTLGEIIDRMFK